MNCETCKEKRIQAEPVSFQAHERDMARMERTNRRLWILLLVLIALFIASNAGWLWYESQFIEESWTFEASTDGGGSAIANGDGEVYYYGQSTSNPPEANP